MGEEAATPVFVMNAQSAKHYGALFGKAAPGTMTGHLPVICYYAQ